MGKKQDQKLLKVNNIYAHSVKVKKSPKNTPIKRTRGASRKGEIRGEPVKEDKKSEDEINIETLPQTSTKTVELTENENTLQRTVTLPVIPSHRPASETRNDQARGAKERRVSFPMINANSYSIFNNLQLEIDKKNEPGIDNAGSDNAAKNSKTSDVTEHGIKESDVKEPEQKPGKTNDNEELDAKQVTQTQTSSQVAADQKILENLLKNLDNENAGTENDEKTGVKKTSKLALFRRAAQATKQAKKVSNALIADLNLRYLHAVYNDTDYNEKYERLNTPDIETDEEKDDELLQEIHEEISSSETQSESEVAIAASSSETESNESEHIDSESDADSPDKIPEEIKEIIENTQLDDGDDLRKLGIWNEEEEVENENEVANSVDEADEADNEESGDDWSIATFEDEDDSVNENTKKKKKAPEVVVNTGANDTQKPLMNIPVPHKFPLPVGDTPDIMLSSGDESTRTIYASQIDEYESDVFGPRLQHDMFYKPPSLKSDAGDSDMFYCVPSLNISFYSTRDYFPGKGKAKAKNEEKKAKKIRHRKELNEQFLKSAMKKYAVQDKAIAQYGNATKAFRLRMAKLGKDPKESDDKANARIERQLRKRLSRKPKKTEELTKNNVKKLPNLSKKARIMRWVKLYDKNGLLKTIYENGWVDQQEDLTQSTTGRIVAKSQDPSSDAKTLAETAENKPVDTAIDKEEVGKEDGQGEGTFIDEKAEYSKTNSSDLKRRKKRKKRKILDNMKKRKEDKFEKSSEESFLISKDWQISVRESKSIDENEEDEETPKSEHSDSNVEQESNSDGGVSACTSSHRSEANMEKRPDTPDSEPEIIAKRPIRYEKRNKKQNIVSRWGVVPGLILSKKRNTLNNELADVTRLLFEQLSLKTKNYSKLPPIKRSGAFSMATSRSARMGQRTSATGESRNSQLLAIGTP